MNLYQASNEDAKNALLAAGTQITLKVVHNPTGLSLFEKEAAMLDETHADAIDVPRPTIEMPKVCYTCSCLHPAFNAITAA